ncbi:glycosyltransferase [Polyangium aurulentum]|uniref:glycosyltransferase n=1 Tax=Polyangium aurulentum TaxID=2567896 RepID=UPI001F3DA717|nr:glycosyltransferase [Polyangium aurulentum]
MRSTEIMMMSRDVIGQTSAVASRGRNADIVCFSPLRWNFVFRRPQHLLTRVALEHRVFFFEDPVMDEGPPRLAVRPAHPGVWVVVPHLPPHLWEHKMPWLRDMVRQLLRGHAVSDYILWYYTPKAMAFTQGLEPLAVVYDCMAELTALEQAPYSRLLEAELLRCADVVFTDGPSLHASRRELHPNVHLLPSGTDAHHFLRARRPANRDEPFDQASIPEPRIGFFGTIDERIDLELLAAVADTRPEWQIVLLGPTKIEPAALPVRSNIHWIGAKRYEELPAYLAGWDVALLPLVRNAWTRFANPTQTLEYLAGGKPVVATLIRDVVRPYAELGIARIAQGTDDFVLAIEACLREGPTARAERLCRIDGILAQMSWDRVHARLREILQSCIAAKAAALAARNRQSA